MKCDFSRAKLLGYFYEDVAAGEKTEIAAHLAGCACCRDELEQLRQTVRALRQWPDEEPNLRLQFVGQKTALGEWLARLRQKSWPKFAMAFAGGLACALVILALMNFEVNYSEGRFSAKFNLFQTSRSSAAAEIDPLEQPVTQREFNDWKQASYELTQRMIADAASQQRYEQRALLSQFARDLDARRREDLQRIGEGLEVFQLVNENKFRRTNEALQQLLYAAYSQNTDTNRIENK
jgi:hypothetical protein